MTSLFESQNVDIRAQSLPNQLEAFKLSDSLEIDRKQVARVIALAIVSGLILGRVHHRARVVRRGWSDRPRPTSTRIVKSQIVWQTLTRQYDARTARDTQGLLAAGVGGAVTLVVGVHAHALGRVAVPPGRLRALEHADDQRVLAPVPHRPGRRSRWCGGTAASVIYRQTVYFLRRHPLRRHRRAERVDDRRAPVRVPRVPVPELSARL